MKSCLFCGSGKLSREHIVPQWVQQSYNLQDDGMAQLVRKMGKTTAFPGKPFDQTVRNICKKCNNGWMAQLEDRVKPYLGPMIVDGAQTELSAEQQADLSLWVVKTAFMFEAMHPNEQTVPRKEYKRLHSTQTVPKQYAAWIAYRANLVDHTGYPLIVSSKQEAVNRVGVPEDQQVHFLNELKRAERFMFVITFAIGHLACQVTGHNFDGTINLGMKTLEGVSLILPSWGPVLWPPRLTVEDLGGLAAFANAFEAGMQLA